MTLDPNDPKLTAYVLGELDDAERAAVEAALAESPELSDAVDAIRRTTELVAEHLQADPAAALTPDQREAILQASDQPAPAPARPRSRRLAISLVAAACVLLAVGSTLWVLPSIHHNRAAEDRVAMLAVTAEESQVLESSDELAVSMDDVDFKPLESDEQLDVVLDDPFAAPPDVPGDGSAFAGRPTGDLLDQSGSRPRLHAYGGRPPVEALEVSAPDGTVRVVPVPSADADTVARALREMGLQEAEAFHDRRLEDTTESWDFDSDGDGAVQDGAVRELMSRFNSLMDEGRYAEAEQRVRSSEPPDHNPTPGLRQQRPTQWQVGGEQPEEVGLQKPGVFSADLDIPTTDGESGRPAISQQVQRGGEVDPRLVTTIKDGDLARARIVGGSEGESATSAKRDSAGDRSGGGQEGGGRRSEPRDRGEKSNKDQKKPATWRRAKATPNASRLMVGDEKDLPLEGMQANVTIDGFRARVLLDYYFYNDGDRQYEGTFKLRLPDEASLYFFAFGESAYRYRPQQKKDVRGAFLTVSHKQPAGGLPEEILKLRADSWNTPKVARVVPREKAAFAYRETVRRRVDPALVEWSGAGVFSARVFPLRPQKLHRIVVGYDVDLTTVDGGREYRLDLPEVPECEVDLNLTTWAGGKAEVTPEVKPFLSNGRACYHFASLPKRELRVRLEEPGTVLLTGADDSTGDYFATRFRPQLPGDEDGTSASRAVFLLDTSLSANPDKFNVWLKLLRAVLEENRGSLDEFAVLTFNVETHWWREAWAENTPENVAKLVDYAHTLSLEGATDLEQALREAASPGWFAGREAIAPWDVFLLGDGALNWGDTNLHVLAEILTDDSSHAGALFAYRTGLAGTETRVLDHLARHTGGAVFAVPSEAEVARVARAHRKRPWQLVDVQLEGTTDLLLAGRPESIFPGQELLLVGRGKPADEAAIVLKLRRAGQKKAKTVRVRPDRVTDSELAPRLYGQVAVGQLEWLGEATGEVATSYARHFRVAGQTCSLVMLESEADYRRFDIKPEDDALVVNSSSAAQVVSTALSEAMGRLLDPKAGFQAWLGRMEKMPGMQFRPSPAFKLAVESLDRKAFEVRTRPLRCKHRTWEGMSSELKEALSTGEVDYEAIAAEADRRMREHGAGDALRACSSLVEHSPGDLAIARDVAYTALAWGLPDQAYHLLRRVAVARPYEPQMYVAMAQSLAEAGRPELAVFYYEVALGGKWDGRFGEFRRIASVDYVRLLRKMAGGDAKRKTQLGRFASARLDSLEDDVKLAAADLVVTVQWTTDGTDVDLHVAEPGGEVCFYQHRSTKIGGRLTPDCTQGFGPEMYTLAEAPGGKYRVQVKYYSSDQNRAGTRTKVYATIYQGWGGPEERVVRKAVVLRQGQEMHDVATVTVGK